MRNTQAKYKLYKHEIQDTILIHIAYIELLRNVYNSNTLVMFSISLLDYTKID